jgi:hypothetical protein
MDDTTLELSVEDMENLRLQLGVDKLENQIANMGVLIDQLLAYANLLDDRLAEFNGEPRVTRHVRPHFNMDTGEVEFGITQPGIPKDIAPPSFLAQERASKKGLGGLIKNGK